MHFSMDKVMQMSEKQMTIAAVVVIGFFVVVYNYVFATPEINPNEMGQPIGITLESPKNAGGETAEDKFRRENKNVTLPDGSKVPADMINHGTHFAREAPFGDKMMEYMVRMPNDWVQSNFARYGLPGDETYAIMTNIARYYGPAIEDARPFFWLEAQKLKRFVTAETYVRTYMLKNGITPVALEATSEKRAEALYVDTRDGRNYAIRTRYNIEGPYIVIASVGIPVSSYNTYKDMAGLVLRSFQLVTPIPGQIEEIIERKLLNVVRYKYYASWLMRNENILSALHPSVELYNPQEIVTGKPNILQGMMFLDAWRMTANLDPKTPLNDVKQKLLAIRMELQDQEPMQPETKLPLRDKYTSITQNRYRALVKRGTRKDEFDIVKSEETKTYQEVWITVLDNGYYRAYLTLVTPLEETDYSVWAQNMAAYTLLINTLQLRPAPTEDF